MTKFITFTSKYDYHPNGQKDLFHASHYLNQWLKENYAAVEIIKWQAVPADNYGLMSIVVEYKNKETHMAEVGY